MYRNKHGTPALKYSESIAEEAQKLAVTLAKQTTKKVTKGIYDVNYFIGDSSVPRTISDAVENWSVSPYIPFTNRVRGPY